MLVAVLISILSLIVLFLAKKNLDLQEKVNQLEFDKIMRGVTADLEGVAEGDSFSQSIYKQRTIQ